jgi:hypothetical protein
MPDFTGWTVPMVGFQLVDIWPSGETYLIFYGPGAPRVQFRFGGDAEFCQPDGTSVILDGGAAWESLVPLFRLRHGFIDLVTVGWDGRIQLRFDDGSSLSAGPDPAYESWELAGPGDLMLVCPPGGGDPRIVGDLPPPG